MINEQISTRTELGSKNTNNAIFQHTIIIQRYPSNENFAAPHPYLVVTIYI